MALKFTDLKAVCDHVKKHVDILTVITEDTGSKPNSSGVNNFIFCPFHDEKNKASFNINTQMQAYRCFGGCQDGGDVIKWVQQYHGVSTPEAIEHLTQRFNIDVSAFVRAATPDELVRERQQYIFNTAAAWCHTQLMNHPSLLQWYREDTGFADEQIEQYRVGYCPSADMMVSFLFSSIQGISKAEIQKLELDNPVQFNDALVYPVHDMSGNTARIYTKPLHPPPTATYKYLGTTNHHPLYKKDLVYGFYQLRKSLRQSHFRVVLLEGFKASIAAAGIAVMGTAITDEQLNLLKHNGVRSIVTCFDGDYPGYIASMKVVEELHRFRGVILKIAKLPLDTQCDGLIKQHGRAAFDLVLANALLPIEFFVSSRFDSTGKLSLEAKHTILADIAPIVMNMNDVEADLAASYVADVIGATTEGIRAHIRDLKVAGSKLVNLKAEESLLQHVLINPKEWVRLKTGLFTDEHFSTTDNQRVFGAIGAAYKEHNAAITIRAVNDKVQALYPKDAERISRRIESITSADPEYSFEVALKNVLDMWQRRTTIKHADDLKATMQDITQKPQDALHTFRRTAVSTIELNDNQAIEPMAVADKVAKLIDDRSRMDSRIIGYDFGKAMPTLNALLSGIQKGHQIVIAANQSVGKSAFALNVINPIAIDQQVPTLWINQEMNEEDLLMRLLSIRTGINNNRLQAGNFHNDDERYAYHKALEDYAQGKLFVRKPVSGTIDEIYSIIEEFKFKHGIEIVVWDYIQLVIQGREQRGMQSTELLQYCSTLMTNRVAGSLNLASICIAQLNRSDYKKGEVRESESIGGAYKIVQDATDVVTLAEKTDKQMEELGKERGNRYINLDKRRGGPSDVVLHANLDKTDKISLRFQECVTPNEIIGFTQALT